MSLKTMLTKSLHKAENGNATFHCAPFFRKFSGKIVASFLLQWWLLTICLLFFLETVAVLRGWALERPFPLPPFSVNSLAELVGAGCCGGGGSPPCCAWAAGTLFLFLFTRKVLRVCFFCRATVPAEHSARFVFVLVAGLTYLIAWFAPAPQNPT